MGRVRVAVSERIVSYRDTGFPEISLTTVEVQDKKFHLLKTNESLINFIGGSMS